MSVSLNSHTVDSAIRNCKAFGVSGVATAGKDTFFVYFQEYLSIHGIKAKRFALADELKRDLEPFLSQKFGIDAFTQNKEQKNLIRPLMVAYGRARRIQSKGTYWTSILTPKIEQAIRDGYVPIVTDIRYCEFEMDELPWMKQRIGGAVIHVERLDENGKIIPPANEDEKVNDPLVRRFSDFPITVATIDDELERRNHYFGIIEKILSNEA